jgi:hypothetical protein
MSTPQKPMAELAAEFGLKPAEYDVVLKRLGREPNLVELGVFSVMWSEHCSYKSSKNQLKKFPIDGPRVICGPGENAGVIDIGDDAIVFKMESHNHPSYIEPYQGAATGVGGILRDVFTMGARPIALPERPALRRAGASEDQAPGGWRGRRHRRLRQFVRRADGRRARCNFHTRYNGNILVNAMAVGLAKADKHLPGGGPGRQPAGRLFRLQDRPRRHPRRVDGLGRVRRGQRGKAPDRAGRRPLRRKAAAGSLPRADGRGLRRSRSRTWAPRASPARRSRWAPRATSASS